MSFASKVLYTGDGNQTQFTVTFPLINVTHLFVYVNDVLQLNPLNYTYTGSTVTFSSAPDSNDAVVLKRSTSPTALLVDFVDGSVLNEADLDLAYQHNFYLLQETVDGFNELINNTLIDVATGAGIVSTVTDEIIAALVNEMLNTASASTIQQRVSDIDANAEAILSLTDDLQVQINTIAQGVAAIVYIQDGEPVPGVGGIPDPIADGARWYDSDDNNKPYIYNQGTTTWVSLEDPRIGDAAADITVLQANVGSNYAAILQELFVQANHTFALASSLTVLGAATADKTAFVIDLDSVLIDTDTGITLATRFTNLSAADGDNAADITTEQTARADGDSAIATTFALLGAENGGGSAFILNEDTVKISSDGGDTLAVRFSGLSASTATVQTNLDTEAGSRATGDTDEATARAADVASLDADISAVQTAYASADAVVASTVTTLAVRVTTNEGDVSQAQVDITSGVSATVTAQTQADAGVADAATAQTQADAGVADAATAQTQADAGVADAASAEATGAAAQSTADTGVADASTAQGTADTNAGDIVTLEAHYGVSLNVNDFITGFLQNNDGNSGSFIILADLFAVVTPTTVWAATTGYTVGQMRRPTSDNSRVFKCTTAGTSDGSEPTWDTTITNTTNDGTVVWTCFDDVPFQPFRITGDKISMNSDVIIDGDLLVTGTINGGALINGTIGSTQIGANAITTTQLNADSITANKIQANAITAEKINVASLSAINADLGAITAGTITMDTSGFMRGGQTAYDDGTGFFLGYSGGEYKFSIGNQSDFLHWDGTTLEVKGNVILGNWVASNTIQINYMTTKGELAAGYQVTSAKYKKITMDRDGTVNMQATARFTGGVPDLLDGEDPDTWDVIPEIVIYKNGAEVDTQDFQNQTHVLFAMGTITFVAGDYIELAVRGGRWFGNVSGGGWHNVTALSGEWKILADIEITGNTVNQNA